MRRRRHPFTRVLIVVLVHSASLSVVGPPIGFREKRLIDLPLRMSTRLQPDLNRFLVVRRSCDDSRFTRTKEIVLNLIFHTTSFLICFKSVRIEFAR